MEKSGRPPGQKRRIGLLALCIALSLPCFAAEDSGEYPVIYTLNPFISDEGLTTYTVLVSGAAPGDVSFALSGGITPMRSKKETRYYSIQGIPAGLYTALEFTVLSPQSTQPEPGELLSAVITVVRGTELAKTEFLISLENSSGPAAEAPEPGLCWQVPESGLAAGKQEELELLLLNAAAFSDVSFSLPENALFSRLPDSPQGNLRFSWTPLSSGELELPRVTALVTGCQGETVPVESEPAAVTVGRRNSGTASPVSSITDAFSPAPQILLQQNEPEAVSIPQRLLFPPFRIMERELAPALLYWREGRYPEALAALRGLEKKSLLFPLYRGIRREAEESLGITETFSPAPGGVVPLAVIGALLFFTVFLLLRRKRPAPALTALFPAAAALIAAILLAWGAAAPQAVHTGGVIKIVPEKSSSASGELLPGTPVRIGKGAAEWAEIYFGGTRAGWTERVFLIPY